MPLKELYISRGIAINYAAVMNDNVLENLYIENCNEKNISGNIYKGRIENIVKGLNAYFVNIGTGKNGILHFEDAKSQNYERGKEIAVQVKREPQEDKGARLTESISIPGKIAIYTEDDNRLHISKKINDKNQIERFEKLRLLLKQYGGGIIRTDAVNYTDEEIVDELSNLQLKWSSIKSSSEYLKSPCLLYDSRDFYNYVIREYANCNVNCIYINRSKDKELIEKILEGNHLECDIPVSSLNYDIYNIIRKIVDYCYKEKYVLPSGGFLYIDKTHSLTSIDVNSGNFTSCNKEETALKTNIEACEEIYKMVVLRNISGIILIDFIDMKNGKYREKLFDKMKSIFKYDKMHDFIYGFTNLQLMEMSRANKNVCMDEIVFSDNENKHYTYDFILKLIEDECCKNRYCYNARKIKISLSKSIITYINNKYPDFKIK